MKTLKIVLISLLLAATIPTLASIPVPLADVSNQGAGSEPVYGAELGGFIYFGSNINNAEFNTKLYRVPVNGTQVEMFMDIKVSRPRDFVVAGSTLFFFVDGALWKSDGTKDGTKWVRNVINAFFNKTPVVMGGEIYFAGSDSTPTGTELWKSDGTFSGTTKWDINSGSGSSSPKFLTAAGSLLFFSANDGSDTELWKTDGATVTEVSTALFPGGSVSPQDISAFGSSSVAFWGWDTTTVNVWATDGTTITNLISSAPLFGMLDLATANDKIFFTKNTVVNSEPRLYTSDGTLAGTTLLDINPGTPTDVVDNLTAAGSLLYFGASTAATGGEWWALDTNTMLGTMLEVTSGVGGTATTMWVGTDTGQLFFRADDGTGSGIEPWISDGTVPGTKMIADLATGPDNGWSNSGISRPFVAQGKFFFDTQITEASPELWRSDGTEAGTVQITRNIDYNNSSSSPGPITESGGGGFFCASSEDGRELWRTDGTTAGTTQVGDLNPGNGSGCLADRVASAGGALYFYGSDGVNSGLWKSDGVTTTAVKSLNYKDQLVAAGALLYFYGDDGSGDGKELWSSDGTPGGTNILKDIYTTAGQSSNIQGLSVVNGNAVFSARNLLNGTELWVSDGTGVGTQVLRNIAADFVNNPPNSSNPSHLTVIGTKLYFAADNQQDGNELWISDGSSGGTLFVDDIGPGSLGSDPRGFVKFGAYVYFSANEDTGRGIELWRTDGTAPGTTNVADIVTGPGDSYPAELTAAGAYLYFTADDGIVGQELWKTDGTSTTMVKDIKPVGSDGSYPQNIFPAGFGNSIYFSAEDAVNDVELWISDGTEANTKILANINPVGSSEPLGFGTVGSQIVFSATTPDSGQELWTFGDGDCGDAPDPTFPTLIASAGACHKLEPGIGPVLGSLRDADPDGQPSATANGDDTGGTDDEDGIAFTSAFAIDGTGSLDVTLTTAGVLNAWIDWQGNGDWGDTGDRVIYNLPMNTGTQSLSIPVPSDGVNPGVVNARFRVTTTGISSPGGIYIDGEVEDYQLTLVDNLDFGDAPDPVAGTDGLYPTLLENNGARARVVAGVYLGSGVDAEIDGQPTVTANGDDADGNDDEDGITFNTPLTPGSNADIDAVVSVDGYLSGWIDFNQDGDWDDSGENIIGDQWVTAGNNNFIFSVPADASNGLTYARFRFDTDSWGYQPTGFAPEGEVEDYQVLVASITTPTADAGVDHIIDPDTETITLGGSPAASDGTPPYSYSWSISPGVAGTDYTLSSSTVANPDFTGITEDSYTATLTVTDDNAQQGTDSAQVDVVFPDIRVMIGLNLGNTATYGACVGMIVDMTVIEATGHITLIAPSYSFGSGFTVAVGAIFSAIIGLPAECTDP